MITTAVVLARGLGTRMRAPGTADLSPAQDAAAASGHKALMPLGEHRLIDYTLSSLADAGIRRAVLVVAPDHADFTAHLASLRPQRIAIELAVQEEPRGTADAVAATQEAVGEEPFLMVNGDNLYPTAALRELLAQEGHALLGFERESLVAGGNIPADRVSAFALVQQEGGILRDILEKPAPEVVAAAGRHALVSMNCFAFTPEIFPACADLAPSPRGELEIVDAVRALDQVHVVPATGGVLDLSRRDDVTTVEELLRPVEVSL